MRQIKRESWNEDLGLSTVHIWSFVIWTQNVLYSKLTSLCPRSGSKIMTNPWSTSLGLIRLRLGKVSVQYWKSISNQQGTLDGTDSHDSELMSILPSLWLQASLSRLRIETQDGFRSNMRGLLSFTPIVA
ncbi:hypothetical protein PanWU01x14_334600 [Parasponia andersonii]|uniref:Uncharacterized protein n=1 Tax=Parasponia andersonii TaxID=3476 RepID=A0A2P5AGG8_PARAD|nr:hypothetical protein PanWU01x14_334600 [Parasponia andersonii]